MKTETIYIVGYDGSGYEYENSVVVFGPDSEKTEKCSASYTKAFTSKEAALEYLQKLEKLETGYCCTTIGVLELKVE